MKLGSTKENRSFKVVLHPSIVLEGCDTVMLLSAMCFALETLEVTKQKLARIEKRELAINHLDSHN